MGIRGGVVARTVSVSLLCVTAAACAGGGGTLATPVAPPRAAAPAPVEPAPAPADAPSASVQPAEEPITALPENRGFDGGTSVVGGFTGVQSSIQDSVISESRGRVWGVLPRVFRTLGVETTTSNAGSYTIGNEGTRIARIQGGRLSTYLDCGNGILGPNADNYDVTMQLMVQLAGNANGTTTVRTTLDAFARPRSSAGAPLHCASQRTLEARVLQLIREELSGVVSRPATSAAGIRVPQNGDYLRVQCAAPLAAVRTVGVGRLLGTGDSQVLLGVGSPEGVVPLPAVSIESVEVRQRTSHSKLGGLVVAVLGGAGGVLLGKAKYDSRVEGAHRSVHYGQGVYLGVGAAGGLLGGFLVGRITGSFFKTDTWVPAPDGWALRVTGATALPVGATAPTCTGFSTGD